MKHSATDRVISGHGHLPNSGDMSLHCALRALPWSHGFQAAAPPQTFAEVRNRCPGTWCCQALVQCQEPKEVPNVDTKPHFLGGCDHKDHKAGQPGCWHRARIRRWSSWQKKNKPAYIVIKTWFYLRHYRTPKFLLKVPLMQAWIKHDKRLFAQKVWRLLKCRQVCICARVCARMCGIHFMLIIDPAHSQTPYAYMYMHVLAHRGTRRFILRSYVRTYVRMYVCVCTYVRMYVSVCVYVCTCVCT